MISSVAEVFDGLILCQSLPMKLESCHQLAISPTPAVVSSCFLFNALSTLYPSTHPSDIHFTYLLISSDTSNSLFFLIFPSVPSPSSSSQCSSSTSSLSIGSSYSFDHLLRFPSSSSLPFEDCKCFNSFHQLLSELSLRHFYLFDPKNSMIQFRSEKKNSLPLSSPSSHCVMHPSLYHAEEISIKHLNFLRPKSITKKDEYSHQPIHLKGIILKIFHAFNGILWIEILGRTQFAKGNSFFIYASKLLSHSKHKGLIDFSSVTIGDSLVFYSVYPVYLWGRLHGFAMTTRSSFETHSTDSKIFPSLFPRLRTTLDQSLTQQQLQQQRASTELPLSKIDYCFLEKKCSVFIAWSAYVNRRIKQCVSSSSSFRYHSADYGRMFSVIMETICSLQKNNCSEFFDIPEVPQGSLLSLEQEFLSADVGPLYAIRAGQDSDYLCSLLPEVLSPSLLLPLLPTFVSHSLLPLPLPKIWSCGMVQQFAINTRRQRLSQQSTLVSLTENPNRCMSWIESTQCSKYRHESHICQHPIVVIASVVDVKISQEMCSIVLCDSIGEKIVTLLPSLKADGTLTSLLKTFCVTSTAVVMVLSFTNPAVFVETFPLQSEESCKVFLLSSEENVRLIDLIPRANTAATVATAATGATVSLQDSVEMTRLLEQYVKVGSSSDVCLDHKGVTNLHSEYLYPNSPSARPYSVREILMFEIYPKQRIPLSCVMGMVKSIQFIPSTSSSLSSTSEGHSQQSSHKRARMEFAEKFLMEFEDHSSSDQIQIYLPVTGATRSLCTVGMTLLIFNPLLKCSANFRSIYLECKLNEYSIGLCLSLPLPRSSLLCFHPPSPPMTPVVAHFTPLRSSQILQASSSSSSSWNRSTNLVSNSFPPTRLVPLSTVANLFSTSFRNRCLWRIRGTISYLREIEIYRRCSFCSQPFIPLTEIRTTSTSASSSRPRVTEREGRGRGQQESPSSCHNCHHKLFHQSGHSSDRSSNNSDGTKTSPIFTWWKCVVVIDDGTSEANLCIEGPNAISFLQSIFQEHESCGWEHHGRERSSNKSNQLVLKRVVTFSDLQRLIEEILSRYPLLQLSSQHHTNTEGAVSSSSVSASTSFSSSTFRPAFGSICLCERFHQLSKAFQSSSSPSSFSSSCNTSYPQFYSTELLHLLHDLMSHCSLSPCYEMTIKLIHSKNSILTRLSSEGSTCSSQFDSGNPLRRYRKVEKKVYLQKLNEPYWTIENIEYLSESFEALRLQCFDLKVLNNEEISEIAWRLIQKEGDAL